jgi:hypothetical protein
VLSVPGSVLLPVAPSNAGVAPALLSPWQPQRLQTDERDGFGFDLPQAARCEVRITQTGFSLDGVTEHDMREF